MDELKYKDKVAIHSWWRRHNGPDPVIAFRCGSVPGIHRRHNRICDFLRYPHHISEDRARVIVESDEWDGVSNANIQKLSSFRYIPNAWDDIPRGGIRVHTSWKLHRDKQYHVVLMDP